MRGLHLHKEDPKTTHKHCPGKNVVKEDLIKTVQAEIDRRNSGEHPADEGGSFGVVKTAQARGDFQVLVERGRRALRVHLGTDVADGLRTLRSAVGEALG